MLPFSAFSSLFFSLNSWQRAFLQTACNYFVGHWRLLPLFPIKPPIRLKSRQSRVHLLYYICLITNYYFCSHIWVTIISDFGIQSYHTNEQSYHTNAMIYKTSMHSSRMRTVHCSDHLGGGGCLPRWVGVSAQVGGGVCPGGWGCLPGGHALRGQNSWHTLVKTLPSRNYCCHYCVPPHRCRYVIWRSYYIFCQPWKKHIQQQSFILPMLCYAILPTKHYSWQVLLFEPMFITSSKLLKRMIIFSWEDA